MAGSVSVSWMLSVVLGRSTVSSTRGAAELYVEAELWVDAVLWVERVGVAYLEFRCGTKLW